jgi:hypothetical protein
MNKSTREIRQQFFSSLKRGTGEAYLLLTAHPAIDFSDLIIKAATNNLAFDPQCEGSRALYIFRLIKKVKQRDAIIEVVLTQLRSQKDDYRGLEQMCDLAVLFFKAGYAEARTALHKRFEKNYSKGYIFCGDYQLVDMDGFDGLLKVAAAVGKKIVEGIEQADSYLVNLFQKKHKKIAVHEGLKKAGRKNKFIAAYYKSILENNEPVTGRKKVVKFSYDLVKEKMDANKFRMITVDRANDLSIEEVEKLASDFLTEKSKQRQALYLRFFAKRKYPFHYEALLAMANGRDTNKLRLPEFAVHALQFFSGKDIRQLALHKLTIVKNPYQYLDLLVGNYRNSDAKMLAEIAKRSDNDEFIHSLAEGFINIYTSNKTKSCRMPLEILYNKMNCGICRESIVRILNDNNVLPVSIKTEIQFDSRIDLRKMSSILNKKVK